MSTSIAIELAFRTDLNSNRALRAWPTSMGGRGRFANYFWSLFLVIIFGNCLLRVNIECTDDRTKLNSNANAYAHERMSVAMIMISACTGYNIPRACVDGARSRVAPVMCAHVLP